MSYASSEIHSKSLHRFYYFVLSLYSAPPTTVHSEFNRKQQKYFEIQIQMIDITEYFFDA